MPRDGLPEPGKATAGPRRTRSRAHAFDRKALGARGLEYERLDQLTVEVILGVRG